MSSNEKRHDCITATLRINHVAGTSRAKCQRRRRCIWALPTKALPQSRNGRLKPIAVTTSRRGFLARTCIRASPTQTTGMRVLISHIFSCCCHQSSSACWCNTAPIHKRAGAWIPSCVCQAVKRCATASRVVVGVPTGKRGGIRINAQSVSCLATCSQGGMRTKPFSTLSSSSTGTSSGGIDTPSR